MDGMLKMSNGCCPDKACGVEIEVPSPAEQEALGALRNLKEEVRAIKSRLASLEAERVEGSADETASLHKKLETLKIQWNEWEERRKKAARERMILLGHEKP